MPTTGEYIETPVGVGQIAQDKLDFLGLHWVLLFSRCELSANISDVRGVSSCK